MVELVNANMLQMIAQFKQNPMQIVSSRYNIPQNINQPQDIVQHLLNTGQVSQQQVNTAMQMRNNPQIQNLFR
jgi:hypothetical protein